MSSVTDGTEEEFENDDDRKNELSLEVTEKNDKDDKQNKENKVDNTLQTIKQSNETSNDIMK